MGKFTPIAMKCNQEQFEAIKPKLEKAGFGITCITSDWDGHCYLVNNFNDFKNNISNIIEAVKDRFERTAYETWNEETFLRACGVEVDTFTITKEQIIEALNDGSKLKEWFPELFEVKPIKMTVAEVEAKLGHPVEIVK
jgi:hypothetical protein